MITGKKHEKNLLIFSIMARRRGLLLRLPTRNLTRRSGVPCIKVPCTSPSLPLPCSFLFPESLPLSLPVSFRPPFPLFPLPLPSPSIVLLNDPLGQHVNNKCTLTEMFIDYFKTEKKKNSLTILKQKKNKDENNNDNNYNENDNYNNNNSYNNRVSIEICWIRNMMCLKIYNTTYNILYQLGHLTIGIS